MNWYRESPMSISSSSSQLIYLFVSDVAHFCNSFKTDVNEKKINHSTDHLLDPYIINVGRKDPHVGV